MQGKGASVSEYGQRKDATTGVVVRFLSGWCEMAGERGEGGWGWDRGEGLDERERERLMVTRK